MMDFGGQVASYVTLTKSQNGQICHNVNKVMK